jgi:hypothetical protein
MVRRWRDYRTANGTLRSLADHDVRMTGGSEAFERLVGNIYELLGQSAGFDLGLSVDRIAQMAHQTAVNIGDERLLVASVQAVPDQRRTT